MNRERTLHFQTLFEYRFDEQRSADELARLLLSMPEFLRPLTVRWEDGKRRARLKGHEARKLSNAIRFLRTGIDDVSYGEVELTSQSVPDFHVFVQWSHPRRIGLNAVFGYVPTDGETNAEKTISEIRAWVLNTTERPLGFVYGNIETLAEWSAKMTEKDPPPDADLRQWLDKPRVTPKAPPNAITDVVWTNLFGKPYVDLIGRDKLLSAPAYRLNELSKGSIVLQVSEHPSDFRTRRYETQCEAIKKHLGHEYFFDWENPDREYPMPKLNVEYVKPRKLSDEELEELRVRAGIPEPANERAPEDKVWIDGLRDWVNRNEEYAKEFAALLGRKDLDYSVDSLRILDAYLLKRRKKDKDPDADLVLKASAYLAQVLARNSPSGEKTNMRVDLEKGHAVIELPNGMVAVPMARIANLWNLGKEEETYLYAKTLLRR